MSQWCFLTIAAVFFIFKSVNHDFCHGVLDLVPAENGNKWPAAPLCLPGFGRSGDHVGSLCEWPIDLP